MELPLQVSRNLKARLLSADHALREAAEDSHALVSRTQRLALLDLLRREKGSLTNQIVADLCVAVTRMRWVHEDLAFLQAELMSEKSKPRRDQQDYSSILNYFPEVFWQKNLNPAEPVGSLVVEAEVMEFAERLGLRNPQEHSAKLLNSVCMVLGNDKQEYSKWSSATKQVYFRNWKSNFKKKIRYQSSDLYPPTLPQCPSDFKSQFPKLYEDCFGDGNPPIRCPSDALHSIVMMDSSYRCRGHGSADASTVSTLQLRSSVETQAPNLKEVTEVLMQGVHAFAMQQQQMFGMLLAQMHGNVPPGAGMPHLSQGSSGSYGLNFGSGGSRGSPGNAAGLMLSSDPRQFSFGSDDSQDSPGDAGALPGLMLSPGPWQGSLGSASSMLPRGDHNATGLQGSLASGLHMLPHGHDNASGLEGLTLPLHGAVQGSPASSSGSPGSKFSLVHQRSTPAKSKESPAKVDFAVLEMPPPQQQELQPSQEQSLATASPGAVLGDLAQQMDMLQAREDEKAAEKKAARALAAMKAREANREADKKQQLDGVAKAPPPKRPKVAAPKVAAAKKLPGKCKGKPAHSSKPCFSIERSRSQVLVRTGGTGPGSSKALKYGPEGAFANEAAAKKEAERMVAALLLTPS